MAANEQAIKEMAQNTPQEGTEGSPKFSNELLLGDFKSKLRWAFRECINDNKQDQDLINCVSDRLNPLMEISEEEVQKELEAFKKEWEEEEAIKEQKKASREAIQM